MRENWCAKLVKCPFMQLKDTSFTTYFWPGIWSKSSCYTVAIYLCRKCHSKKNDLYVIVSMECKFLCLSPCVIQPSKNRLQVLRTHLRPTRNGQKILRWATLAGSLQPDLQGKHRNESSLADGGDTIHLSTGNHITAGVSIAWVGKLPIYGYVINFGLRRR